MDDGDNNDDNNDDDNNDDDDNNADDNFVQLGGGKRGQPGQPHPEHRMRGLFPFSLWKITGGGPPLGVRGKLCV